MLKPNTPTRSRACASNACAEVTLRAGAVEVRDSKPGGAAVLFTVDAWRRFAAGLKAGDLDG